MGVATSLLTWALVIAPTGPGAAAPPLPVALAPVSTEALHDCDVADLESALRRAFGRAKSFRLVPPPEDAPARLEILECSRLEQHKQTITSKGGPAKVPVVRGVGRSADREIGVQTEAVRAAMLRARVVAGSRFVTVASGPKDRTLREAADTLRRAIDRAIGERGQWLLASRP